MSNLKNIITQPILDNTKELASFVNLAVKFQPSFTNAEEVIIIQAIKILGSKIWSLQ